MRLRNFLLNLNLLRSVSQNSQWQEKNRLQGVVIAQAATYGGMMTNFGRRFAEKVISEGGELHFFCSSLPIYGNLPPIREIEEIGGIYHGFKIPRLPSPFLDLIAVIKMARRLRKLKVQIFHTRSAHMSVIGGIAGRLAGVPIIVHHQDDLYWRDPRFNSVVKWFIGLVERCVSQLYDKSLFVTRGVLDDALKLGFHPDRCVLVGLDLHPIILKAAQENDVIRKVRHPAIEKLGIPPESLLIGSIGRLVPEKGFDTLLLIAKEICPEFPDCYFLIKGNGPLRPVIEAKISEFGLSNRVFLLTEKLPRTELSLLYRSFDVFILPTRREGFGMVFAEAMAFGVPVIGPNIPPVNEVIGKGCGVLVEPENISQYCDALRTLIRSSALRKEIGLRGREYAIKTWGGESAADRVIQVYCELLQSKGFGKVSTGNWQ